MWLLAKMKDGIIHQAPTFLKLFQVYVYTAKKDFLFFFFFCKTYGISSKWAFDNLFKN